MNAARLGSTACWAVFTAGPALAAGPVELYGAPVNPTARECAALANHNAMIARRLVDSHGQCLDRSASASFGDYSKADPCSKVACRPIHLQMDWVREQSIAINRDCRARIPKESLRSGSEGGSVAEAGQSGSAEAKRWALKADELLESAKKAVGIVKDRDRPWALAEMAWGEAAARVRRELADRVSGGATKNDLDWNVYDLIFNKAYDAQIANAQAARNPVARIVNEAMLSRLYLMQAQALGQFQQALKDMDQVSRELPALPSSNRLPPVFYRAPRGPASLPATPRPGGGVPGECAIFGDTARSAELLSADPAGWMALNNRCNGGR